MALEELQSKLKYQGIDQNELDYFMVLYGLAHQAYEGQELRENCSHGGYNPFSNYPMEHTKLSFIDKNNRQVFDMFVESYYFKLTHNLEDGSSYSVKIGLQVGDKTPTYADIRYYSPEKPMNPYNYVSPTKHKDVFPKEGEEPIHIEDYFNVESIEKILNQKNPGCLARIKKLFGKKNKN